MKRFAFFLFLILATLPAKAALSLLSAQPQTNSLQMSNYVVVVLRPGESNVTLLIRYENLFSNVTARGNTTLSGDLIGTTEPFIIRVGSTGFVLSDSATDIYPNGGATFGVTTPWPMGKFGFLYAGNSLAAKAIFALPASGVSNAVGGLINYSTASFTNLNGTPGTLTNLANFSVPGNTLTNLGDGLRGEWGGLFQIAAAGTNRLQMDYGGNTYLDTGLQIASNCTFYGWSKIRRTGNTTAHVDAHFEWGPGGATPFAFTNVNVEITVTHGVANTLAMKGACQRPGGMTNNSFQVWSEPYR